MSKAADPGVLLEGFYEGSKRCDFEVSRGGVGVGVALEGGKIVTRREI